MRFVVELYRFLILGLLAFCLIAASYVISKVLMSPEATSGTAWYLIAGILTAFGLMILGIGVTATFISMHDRIEELSNNVETLVSLQQTEAVMHDEATESAE